MFCLHINLYYWFRRFWLSLFILKRIILFRTIHKVNILYLLNQFSYIFFDSLSVVILTACFISMVFTFQVGKELVSLNTTHMLGAILTTTFIRELCPVLTAVIVTAKVGSAFTAEIASMQVTEQINILLILKIDPIYYLVIPRLYVCVLLLPLFNIFSIITSICISIFLSSVLYKLAPSLFIYSLNGTTLSINLIYSLIKTLIFGFVIALISCSWGLSTKGGARNVGLSTTSSVVTILLFIFSLDCFLSYIMFYHSESIFSIM
uniref:ABC transporter permease n=1 Tax=Kumanoa americana TaxID=1196377 RepID=A0A1C9CGN6_9FLOR|nr:hypothetical protein Kuma_100 [Kumanoa americana]AOM67534.1 hypothetical protein Kuma_100 [Kumanoa americana]